ncbi:c-type cytochrome [Thioalkalivibrio nitratireducens]|uniref:c-type cytochrome n=1 Tax=Thioalkalivibrio nitratireducens TaxID=186931 RepID=UPI001B80B6D1|nr:cytochrome c [Thioalkalivibrio nitratireducens]
MKWSECALVLLLGLGSTMAIASPAERGEAVHREKGCDACHGERGASVAPDQFPHLSGQYASYLEHALRGYRDGSRRHAVMNQMAADLSDREIRELAAFYAAQSGLVTAPRGHPRRDQRSTTR